LRRHNTQPVTVLSPDGNSRPGSPRREFLPALASPCSLEPYAKARFTRGRDGLNEADPLVAGELFLICRVEMFDVALLRSAPRVEDEDVIRNLHDEILLASKAGKGTIGCEG